MTIIEFLNQLLCDNGSDLKPLISSAIYDIKSIDDFAPIKKHIEGIDQQNFTYLADKIVLCISCCKQILDEAAGLKNENYYKSVEGFSSVLNKIFEIIKEVEKGYDNQIENLDSISSVLNTHTDKMRELNDQIRDIDSRMGNIVENANRNIDSKVFSLLINTVAILGIFVALAFAGVGVSTVFANLDIISAIDSRTSLIRFVFVLMLISLFSYNLLLLLVYFIFKLSRPIIGTMRKNEENKSNGRDNSKKRMNKPSEKTSKPEEDGGAGSVSENTENQTNVEDTNPVGFYNSVNLNPFFIIDGIVFALTIALFVASIIIQ